MDSENQDLTEKVKKYWVELDAHNHPMFLFINPTADGSCTALYVIKAHTFLSNKPKVYYNNCRQITLGEYVTFRLLGVISENGRYISS